MNGYRNKISSPKGIVTISGGVRCGKSRQALELFGAKEKVGFFATAHAMDEEMKQRIVAHQQERPGHWQTWEPPHTIHSCLDELRRETFDGVVLDCVTLWLAWEFSQACKRYSAEHLAGHLKKVTSEFLTQIEAMAGLVRLLVVVTNEVGWGVVPEHKSGRQFRDLLGALNQDLMKRSQGFLMMVSGVPLVIKGGELFEGAQSTPVMRLPQVGIDVRKQT